MLCEKCFCAFYSWQLCFHSRPERSRRTRNLKERSLLLAQNDMYDGAWAGFV